MLTERDERRLAGVHPDLVAVVRRAADIGAGTGRRFRVTCGCRSIEEQRRLVAEGKSKTLRSRHLTGHAVDLVSLTGAHGVSYSLARMQGLNACMMQAAGELGVPLEWGGDWTTFKDTPHWQLPHAAYPAEAPPKPKAKAKPEPEPAPSPEPEPDPVDEPEAEPEPAGEGHIPVYAAEEPPAPTATDAPPAKPLAASKQANAGTAEAAGGAFLHGLSWQEILATAKSAGGIVPALHANPLLAVLLGLSVGMIGLGLFQVWDRRTKRRRHGI